MRHYVVIAAAVLVLIVIAVSPVSASSGSFCVHGTVTAISRTWAPGESTTCGSRTTSVVTIGIDLDACTRVYVHKGFSPDAILCAASSLGTGQPVTICGVLQGQILNPGTANETSVVTLYPTSIEKW